MTRLSQAKKSRKEGKRLLQASLDSSTKTKKIGSKKRGWRKKRR
jgi:hypothetical protein